MLKAFIISVFLIFTLPQKVWADVQYIHLEPAFVVNYGSSGRMRYLKTEIALKVSTLEAAAKVSAHKPYIRNNLVLLFSEQEPETVMNTEALRKTALSNIQELMTTLEEEPCVDDLYFNNFVIQN